MKRLLMLLTLGLAAAVLVVPFTPARRAEAATVPFTFVNNAGQTIWVGALNNPGQPLPEAGGFALNPGETRTLQLPDNWQGRFWGRTGCVFNGATGRCETGDCGGRLQCNGIGGDPPASLAEFTLSGAGDHDFYDVSFVDGYNVPMSIVPIGGSPSPSDPFFCTEAGCGVDLNPNCPVELRLVVGGRTVGCKSACLAFNTDQFCCRNAFGSPQTCNPSNWPTNYAQYFKSACPRAYSYAYDDPTSTFQCQNCGYRITFGRLSTAPPSNPPPTTPPPPPPGGGGGNAYSTIQAEAFGQQSGTITEATTDTGGGQDIGSIANGDWAQYPNVDFGTTAARQFSARVASGAAAGVSGLVEVRLDSRTAAPIGSFALANTGGWQSWRTVPANISAVTGTHTVFLTFTSGQPANFVNVNWFVFGH